MGRLRWLVVVMVATVAVIAAGPQVVASAQQVPIFPTTTAKPPPTTRPRPRPTTTTTVFEQRVPEQGYGPGDEAPAIETAELMLNGQRYDVGKIDKKYDGQTAQAVMAFQKIHGLERTGRLTRETAARMRAQKAPPPPLMSEGGAKRIEVDLPRQIALLIEDNTVHRVLAISSGNGKHYCENGHCGTAITRVGAYRTAYSVKGWQKGPLGPMYNPVYYDTRRGIAIHGSKSVPSYPASHGCVRIPMGSAEWFPGWAGKGTPVYVLDGHTYVQPLS